MHAKPGKTSPDAVRFRLVSSGLASIEGNTCGSPVMASIPGEVPERISFPQEEERILERWRAIKAFETSNKLSEGRPVYSFYDGPPFATGLPHYGHLLAGTIKDTVTRYAYQTGHHVPRRFGWDCHGLPVEFEIEKKLNIKTREDVLALGIDKYNAECRSIVMRFSAEWEKTVQRIGRWIDFENDYKTLDTSFMESVWWVFKTLYDKGLVYRGFKVMPYSMGCTTPLSNFEANLNYKDTNDPAVTVRFPLVVAAPDDPNAGASFLAWTTTPWTLPSNIGLCVNPELSYVFVLDKPSNHIYVLAESRLAHVYKNPNKNPSYQLLRKVKGSDLVGLKYEPLFDYFVDGYGARAFKVLSDSYVTDSDGTGIVHQAPAFGEDDYRVCLANGVIDKGEHLPCPVDDSGRFISPVSDFIGIGVKEADKLIIAKLKEIGRLVKNENLSHSYPFCWRSDTPLIYKAVPSWFVRVESIKDQLIANNALTRWVPESVQHNRFGNWLQNARDWNVSRNRYWGTPLPIWRNETSGEVLVVGSIQELSDLSGIPVANITDLHRESVDTIEIVSPATGDVLCRVSEVFDCWFESGSMPYASAHYPYGLKSKETLSSCFPADFIAEGLDQTRGWFYTLMVLSTALFDKPAFKNCVVNGLVLASDGKKMSKRLQNYPDPVIVINSHGADALRLYLINSPVVRGEPLRFREDGVRDVIRDVMLPWFNAYRFLIQNIRLLSASSGKPLALADKSLVAKHKNQMDLWLESSLGSLITFVREEMSANRLYTVVPKLLSFIDSLTNWYVRLNRPRLKGTSCSEDGQRAALSTLADVLISLSRLMAPFAPFFSEYTYQTLKEVAPRELVADSVHYLMLPEADKAAVDHSFEKAVSHMQEVILLGRVAREHRDLAIKKPLKEALIVHREESVLDAVKMLESYLMLEINVRAVRYSTNESDFVLLKADADGRALGKKLGKSFKAVHAAVRAMSPEQVCKLEETGQIELEGHTLSAADIKVSRELRKDLPGGESLQVEAAASGLLLVLNTEQDDDLIAEGLAREMINRVQKLRKKARLDPKDRIEVFIETAHQSLLDVLETHSALFASALNVPRPLDIREMSGSEVLILQEDVDPVKDMELRIHVVRAGLVPSVDRLATSLGGNKVAAETVALYLRSRSPAALGLSVGNASQTIDVLIAFPDSKISVTVKMGGNCFRSTAERVEAGAGV
jgi:isoleucyl-tRNA synthetase